MLTTPARAWRRCHDDRTPLPRVAVDRAPLPRMKVALLSFEYPAETGYGGIGTYTWYQARALVKLGHTVHVLAGANAPTALRREEHDGVVVHRFRADGALMRAFEWLGRPKLWWTRNRLENALSMFRGLRSLIDAEAYDLIEMPECGAEGLLVNHLLRTPTVVRFHSPARLIMQFYDVPRADVVLCGAVEQMAIRGARAYSACSQFLADEVQTKLNVRPPVQVIPNGIDLDLFDTIESVDIRRQYALPEGRPLIVFTGRLEPRKGIHLCPEIVSTVLQRHDVAFAFAGRDLFGHFANTVRPAVERHQLRGSLHHLGDLNLAAVRSLVREADVFWLPSIWENCPYSCLEAMAAGRAILCSDQGGMPELIQHEQNGLLARSGDPASYIEQLERLIENAELRQRLGAAARRTVETSLTDVHVAERSVAYYREVIARG